MPYIKALDRQRVDDVIRQLPGNITPGDIAYIVSLLFMRFLNHACLGGFHTMAVFEGAVQLALKEIYRRCIAPYEDTKIVENGDVF